MRKPSSFLRQAVLTGLVALTLSACASTPKPQGPVVPLATTPPPQATAAPTPDSQTTTASEAPRAPVPGTSRDFVVNVGDHVYFDFDRYTIREDARPILDAQAAWLSRYSAVHVRIEGNCDEQGTREYNFALGARRADSARQYLISHGVAAGRIETVSYSSEHPTDTGDGEEAQAHNRNARTAITTGAQ